MVIFWYVLTSFLLAVNPWLKGFVAFSMINSLLFYQLLLYTLKIL